MSGQWIPYPPPATFQFALCRGVAWSSRGYHASGTIIVRPSRRSTRSESLVHRTSLTRSPGCTSIFFIPPLKQFGLMSSQYSLDFAQFTRAESQVSGERYWVDPELGWKFISVNVHVRRLANEVMTVKVESIRADSEHCWHDKCYSRPGSMSIVHGA